MAWYHNYAALADSLGLTALVVSIPIIFLFWALAVKRMKGHVAGVLTLLLTLVIVIATYRMPVGIAVSAAALGIVTGLLLIGWIILTALFFYNLTVEAGQFDVLKSSICALSSDRRLQALLIAFCFSAFMEGISGQGAPVAVCAAMLIGLGFPALPAAVICLVANTPPVPFGPVGVPTNMMVTVTKINALVMSQAIGIDMSILALIIPVFMLVVMVGWKKAMEVLPAAMVAGISYAIANLIVSTRVGMELPAIISSFVSMIALTVFLKFWEPKSIWRFPGEPEEVIQELEKKYTTAQVVKAWSPFVILVAIMGLWGMPSFKNWIVNELHWAVIIRQWPGLHGLVYTTVPGAKPAMYVASYRWEFFTVPGTAIFISSLVTMVVLGISPSRGAKVFVATFKQLRFALITLCSVISIGFVANYSGMSYTLGLACATYTGKLFPIFSPIIGWVGTFLTGSVTSSAALFGKLQQVTAMRININPVLTTSANLFGSDIGKLISPQSIAIACAATGLVGREPDIIRKTVKYSVMLLGFTIVVVLLQAYVVPGVLPQDTTALAP
jgi:L-lactate transport